LKKYNGLVSSAKWRIIQAVVKTLASSAFRAKEVSKASRFSFFLKGSDEQGEPSILSNRQLDLTPASSFINLVLQ